MIHRDPKGAFCSPEAMLVKWMPVMLSWMWGRHLITAMQALCAYCETRFFAECERIGSSAKFAHVTVDGAYQERLLRDGKLWLEKRDILKRCMEEIEALERR